MIPRITLLLMWLSCLCVCIKAWFSGDPDVMKFAAGMGTTMILIRTEEWILKMEGGRA